MKTKKQILDQIRLFEKNIKCIINNDSCELGDYSDQNEIDEIKTKIEILKWVLEC